MIGGDEHPSTKIQQRSLTSALRVRRTHLIHLDERVGQPLDAYTHGTMPIVAPASLLDGIPIHVDDLVKVANEHLGYLGWRFFFWGGGGGGREARRDNAAPFIPPDVLVMLERCANDGMIFG